MILWEWDAREGHHGQRCVCFCRRLSPQFQFSLSDVTLVYLSQWFNYRPARNYTREYTQSGNGRFLAYFPSRIKLQCTLQLRGQINSSYFISTPLCTLWTKPIENLMNYQRRYFVFHYFTFFCFYIHKKSYHPADVLLELILKGIISRAAGDLCLEFLKATPEI